MLSIRDWKKQAVPVIQCGRKALYAAESNDRIKEEDAAMQTSTTGAIYAAGKDNTKITYDANAKAILSNRYVLAYILKYVTKEFKNREITDIINCIEGTQVGEESVLPNTSRQENIIGLNTEDTVQNEGTIYYDVSFFAYVKNLDTKIQVKLYIDVELQNKYHPGYDIVTRSLFYCARELSRQYNTEFTGKDYDGIKKVYSIWICADSPAKYTDTITAYKIGPEQVYGEYKGNPRYDILESVIIRMRGESTENSKNILIRMLSTLFSLSRSKEDKIQELEKSFAIPAGKEFGEELELMCNLSQAIEKRGIEKGIEKGKELGIKQGKELGELDALKRVAVIMYKNGEDIEYISKSTQVPERQIELWLKEKEEDSEE